MYLLLNKNEEERGAYCVFDNHGDRVLFLFEEEDDADRYAMMLYEDSETEVESVEIDAEVAIKACQTQGCKYTIVTPNDIVIPPFDDDKVWKN